MFNKEVWRHFDYWLFGAVVVLSIFGIAMIRSAIAGTLTWRRLIAANPCSSHWDLSSSSLLP